MTHVLAEKVECLLSGLDYWVKPEDDSPTPGKGLAPATIHALAYLYHNDSVEWARAARVVLPNGMEDWLVEHSENTDQFEDRSIQHGAVYQSDFVEGYEGTTESSETHVRYQGRINEKLHDGTSGFRAQRKHLDDPEVKSLLEAGIQQAEQ